MKPRAGTLLRQVPARGLCTRGMPNPRRGQAAISPAGRRLIIRHRPVGPFRVHGTVFLRSKAILSVAPMVLPKRAALARARTTLSGIAPGHRASTGSPARPVRAMLARGHPVGLVHA